MQILNFNLKFKFYNFATEISELKTKKTHLFNSTNYTCVCKFSIAYIVRTFVCIYLYMFACTDHKRSLS